MPIKAVEEVLRINGIIKMTENQIYSCLVPYMRGIAKDTYREFQEKLKLGEEASLLELSGTLPTDLNKITKDGFEIGGEIVSADQYIDLIAGRQKTDERTYNVLRELIIGIQVLAHEYNIKLEGKYLPENIGKFKLVMPVLTGDEAEITKTALKKQFNRDIHPLNSKTIFLSDEQRKNTENVWYKLDQELEE